MADRLTNGFVRDSLQRLVVVAASAGLLESMRNGFKVDEHGRVIVVGPNGEPIGGGGSTFLLNVKDPTYGAKGDGATDDATAIGAALAAAAAAGGGIVFLPAGTYIVNSTLAIDSKVTLLGSGKEATTIKLANGKNVPILRTARFNEGGTTGGAIDFTIRDLGFDGNKANNAGMTVPVVDLDGLHYEVTNVYIKNGQTMNFRSQMSRAVPEAKMDAAITDLYCEGAGETNIDFQGPQDSVLTRVKAQANCSAANIIAGNISNWTDCHPYGNSKYSWEVTGFCTFTNCQAEGAKSGQVMIRASSMKWIGGRVFYGGGEDGRLGFVFGAGAVGCQIEDVEVANCHNGAFKFEAGTGAHTTLGGFVYGEEAKPAIVGSPPEEEVDAFNLRVALPMTLGGEELLHAFGSLTFTNEGDISTGSGRIELKKRAAAPSAPAEGIKLYALEGAGGKMKLMARGPKEEKTLAEI